MQTSAQQLEQQKFSTSRIIILQLFYFKVMFPRVCLTFNHETCEQTIFVFIHVTNCGVTFMLN